MFWRYRTRTLFCVCHNAVSTLNDIMSNFTTCARDRHGHDLVNRSQIAVDLIIIFVSIVISIIVVFYRKPHNRIISSITLCVCVFSFCVMPLVVTISRNRIITFGFLHLLMIFCHSTPLCTNTQPHTHTSHMMLYNRTINICTRKHKHTHNSRARNHKDPTNARNK